MRECQYGFGRVFCVSDRDHFWSTRHGDASGDDSAGLATAGFNEQTIGDGLTFHTVYNETNNIRIPTTRASNCVKT